MGGFLLTFVCTLGLAIGIACRCARRPPKTLLEEHSGKRSEHPSHLAKEDPHSTPRTADALEAGESAQPASGESPSPTTRPKKVLGAASVWMQREGSFPHSTAPVVDFSRPVGSSFSRTSNSESLNRSSIVVESQSVRTHTLWGSESHMTGQTKNEPGLARRSAQQAADAAATVAIEETSGTVSERREQPLVYYSPRSKRSNPQGSFNKGDATLQARATHNASQDVELKIDESWSFAALGKVLVDVRNVVEEQQLMLRELADDAVHNITGDDIGRRMLMQRSDELGTQLELLNTMLPQMGAEDASKKEARVDASAFLQALRDRRPQEKEAEAKELGVDTAGMDSTPKEDRLRLRASGIYSAKRSLEAQAKRLKRVASSLPAMAPALKPLLTGLEAETQELVRLLEHTIRQLEMAKPSAGKSISQQQEWLAKAEMDTQSNKSDNESSDNESEPRVVAGVGVRRAVSHDPSLTKASASPLLGADASSGRRPRWTPTLSPRSSFSKSSSQQPRSPRGSFRRSSPQDDDQPAYKVLAPRMRKSSAPKRLVFGGLNSKPSWPNDGPEGQSVAATPASNELLML